MLKILFYPYKFPMFRIFASKILWAFYYKKRLKNL